MCREAPSVSNLLFVDDSLNLMAANMLNANTPKGSLDSYCVAFGRLVSFEKCNIFFNPYTRVGDRTQICTSLNIMIEALNDKYLGLLATMGLDKTDCFQYLIDRICKRVNGWKER